MAHQPPRGPFHRRCYLCGDPCYGTYCHAHTWAGKETTGKDELTEARIYRDGFRDGRRSAILPNRPAGSLELVTSRSESPAGRPPSQVKSVSAGNRQLREATP